MSSRVGLLIEGTGVLSRLLEGHSRLKEYSGRGNTPSYPAFG